MCIPIELRQAPSFRTRMTTCWFPLQAVIGDWLDALDGCAKASLPYTISRRGEIEVIRHDAKHRTERTGARAA